MTLAPLKALILNCSLKKSDEPSNTDALLNEFVKIFVGEQVEAELIRVVDYNIAYGIAEDMGDGDEWPQLFEKIKEADILLMGTPVWLGEKSSVSKKVLERFNGSSTVKNEKGQPVFYNKVAGAVVTGNEDGAKNAAGDLIFGLSQIGYAIPPNPIAYWVGEAGPGPSFIEAEGYKNEFTQSNVQMAGHNLVHLARIFQQQPIPLKGNAS
ncbi:flavodoxin family protein [Sediminibacillus dalangtanensis]|uniref:Flavodoxin family protein n=1 Tax=Sediminibacillus dalangtanensis TaxID=2729421 RepID=A0ABX7VMJ0_9BACI|nr:flavodoxin family protein [Sediminibacillus dalangtanensis]QTM97986.1 flavodoxin family protein [Sediminibacillus dalangtanensis]